MLCRLRVVPCEGILTFGRRCDIIGSNLEQGEIVNNNIITSPAYMAVPGNIYNTILMDDNEDIACGQNQAPDGKDVAICLGICLLFSAIVAGGWLWIMHKKGF